jgi:hypothetical protein
MELVNTIFDKKCLLISSDHVENASPLLIELTEVTAMEEMAVYKYGSQ